MHCDRQAALEVSHTSINDFLELDTVRYRPSLAICYTAIPKGRKLIFRCDASTAVSGGEAMSIVTQKQSTRLGKRNSRYNS